MEINIVEEFEKFHQIKIRDNWENGNDCLIYLTKVRSILKDTIIANGSEKILVKYPSMGVIHQLSERIFEQIIGGVSCFCTKNGASSEILARTAIESSVNIIYMLTKDTESQVYAWFYKYLSEDIRQIQDWEKSIDQENTFTSEKNLPRIAKRKELYNIKLKFVNDFFDQIPEEIDINKKIELPRKILQKFKAIGEETAYHTVYTRLCAQSHQTAEDTINFIMISCLGDEKQQLNFSLETWAFSEYMLIYAIYFYCRVAESFCYKYANHISVEIDMTKNKILDTMIKIAEEQQW